jgi:hypothetical protein
MNFRNFKKPNTLKLKVIKKELINKEIIGTI